MIFECSGLKNASDRYGKVLTDLTNSYNCDWNDEVHASFKKFIVECEEYSSAIKYVKHQSEQACQELNSLNIDQEKSNSKKLNNDAFRLCQEARSLL